MMAGEFVTLLGRVWDELRADADPRFDPPHSTVQATVIQGGTAVNILAKQAEVTWEYRCLPDRDPVKIVERVKAGAAAEILPKYSARAPIPICAQRRVRSITRSSWCPRRQCPR